MDPEWSAPVSELSCGQGRLVAHVLAVFPAKPGAVEPTFPGQKLARQGEGHVPKLPRTACRRQLAGHVDGAATFWLYRQTKLGASAPLRYPEFPAAGESEPGWLLCGSSDRCAFSASSFFHKNLLLGKPRHSTPAPQLWPSRDPASRHDCIHLLLIDIQPTHGEDGGKMLAIRDLLFIDIKESVHRSPQ